MKLSAPCARSYQANNTMTPPAAVCATASHRAHWRLALTTVMDLDVVSRHFLIILRHCQ